MRDFLQPMKSSSFLPNNELFPTFSFQVSPAINHINHLTAWMKRPQFNGKTESWFGRIEQKTQPVQLF